MGGPQDQQNPVTLRRTSGPKNTIRQPYYLKILNKFKLFKSSTTNYFLKDVHFLIIIKHVLLEKTIYPIDAKIRHQTV